MNYTGLISGTPRRLEARALEYPGLTEQEASALRALVQLGQAGTADLLRKTELQKGALARALKRLLALDYAQKSEENGQTLYRPSP